MLPKHIGSQIQRLPCLSNRIFDGVNAVSEPENVLGTPAEKIEPVGFNAQ
jgi:hypothetical protein